jgi:hypothetical protein
LAIVEFALSTKTFMACKGREAGRFFEKLWRTLQLYNRAHCSTEFVFLKIVLVIVQLSAVHEIIAKQPLII